MLEPLSRRLAGAVLIGALGLVPQAAAAQQPRAQDRAVTDGVDRVYHDYSAEGDASSLELNPAMLSAIRGFDLTLLGYGTTSDFTRGTGFGAFSALSLGFGLAFGFGFQAMQPGLRDRFDFDAANNPDATKLSFGLSGGDREHGSFGVGIHGVRSDGRWLRRPDLDIGGMTRIFNFAAVGFAARLSPVDLSQGELRSELSLIGEVTLRPLGTRTLEIAGGLKSRVFQDQADMDLQNLGRAGVLPRARIALRYHGLALKAEVEQVRAIQLDPMSLVDLRDEKVLRGSVAIEAAWDFVSAGAGVHAGVSDGLDGVGGWARFTSARQGRAFWGRRVDAERIDLESVKDERSLISMLQRLERAQRSGKRSVLVIDARNISAGWASLQELRDALIEVRNAGGHVFAYLENTSLKEYYVASAAERIFIHPAGELSTYGISSSMLYFKGILDKLGVRVEALHIDEYKSAHERLTRTGPSKYDREQRRELLRDTYAEVVRGVAQARQKSTAKIRELFNDSPHGPKDAVDKGLVDEVVFRDQLLEQISEDIGASVEFKLFPDTAPRDKTWAKAPFIAVVLIEGTIIDGESRFIPFFNIRFTGGDTIAKTLESLRKDPACRGIVLRVNSGGGSALASDVMWREVQLTHEAWERDARFNPPIVTSMSDVAASGGYYVPVGTPTILAQPTTITGSIGVVSMHFDVSGLLAKLGISSATFKEGKNPDIDSPYKPYTKDQRKRLEASMRRIYDLFLTRVSATRKMTKKKVNELGRGHVYSGVDAKALGLVDGLGGLDDAIALLRERADVPKFRKLEVRVLPRRVRLLDIILNALGAGPKEPGIFARHRTRQKAKRDFIPAVVNEALARIPLHLLFLPQDTANTIVPGIIELE